MHNKHVNDLANERVINGLSAGDERDITLYTILQCINSMLIGFPSG